MNKAHQIEFKFELFRKRTCPGFSPAAGRFSNRFLPHGPALCPAPELQEHARALLRGIGLGTLATKITVFWNRRLRSTAGIADYSEMRITLNPSLIQFGKAEVERTLRHELAHFVAKQQARNRRIAPHGPEWRLACAQLGIPDETVRHTLSLPQRQQAPKHRYQCPHCKTVVDRVRPYRRPVACRACCRKHNRGRFDKLFQFVKIPLNKPASGRRDDWAA